MNYFAPGASTLFLNLCCRFDVSLKRRKTFAAKMYQQGMQNLIVQTIVPSTFYGMTFRELSLHSEMRRLEIVPLAIWTVGFKIFTPQPDFKISFGQTIILVVNAENMEDVASLFKEIQPGEITKNTVQEDPQVSVHRISRPGFDVAGSSTEMTPISIMSSLADTPLIARVSTSDEKLQMKNEMLRLKARIETLKESTDQEGTITMKRELVVSFTGHIVVCLASDAPRRSMRFFITHVRRRDRKCPVVFLGSTALPPAWLCRVSTIDSNLHYVRGSPQSSTDLARTGLYGAKSVFILSDSSLQDDEVRDSKVMTTMLIVQKLFMPFNKYLKHHGNVVMEYFRGSLTQCASRSHVFALLLVRITHTDDASSRLFLR